MSTDFVAAKKIIRDPFVSIPLHELSRPQPPKPKPFLETQPTDDGKGTIYFLFSYIQ